MFVDLFDQTGTLVVLGVLVAAAAYAVTALIRRRHALSEELCVAEDRLQELQSQNEHLRRLELDLRESQAFNEALFQAAQTGMLVVDARTLQIMDANRAACVMLGSDLDDLLGLALDPFLVLDRRDETMRLLKADEPTLDSAGELLRANGDTFPVLHSVKRLTGQNAHLLVLSFQDISRQKAAELEVRESNERLAQANQKLEAQKDQIVQSEKLASIGQLAAGVAHEINNPIGYVTSNLGTLVEYTETLTSLLGCYRQLATDDPSADIDEERLRKEIKEIEELEDVEFVLDDVDNVLNESMEGVHRVAEIVQNLKSFAREEDVAKRPQDINAGIDAMIKMVWNELKYRCTVEKDFGDLPLITCHIGQVNQVFMNMLVNASHAMPEQGGTITVTTRVQGEEIVVSIADNGCGMSPEVLSRIFDPFYTTKEVGSGTGLGLSISHGIIQDHGGHIEVDSTEGEGTEFRIYLPTVAAAAAAETASSAPGASEQTVVGLDEELIG